MTVRRRLPAYFACAVGFFAYFTAGALFGVLPVGHVAAVVVLLAIAAVVGWWATLPGALLTGLFGWPFYSGFVTHTHAQLGVTGPMDAAVAVLLLVAAVGASLASRLRGSP